MITGEAETEFSTNSVELTLECIWTDEVNRIGGRSPSRLPIFTSFQTSAPPVYQRSNRARTKLEKEITEQFAKVISTNFAKIYFCFLEFVRHKQALSFICYNRFEQSESFCFHNTRQQHN